MCSVGVPGCGTRPMFHPRNCGVRKGGINAWTLIGLETRRSPLVGVHIITKNKRWANVAQTETRILRAAWDQNIWHGIWRPCKTSSGIHVKGQF